MSLLRDFKQNTKLVWQFFAMLFLGVIATTFVLCTGGIEKSKVSADNTLPPSALSGFVFSEDDTNGDFELVDTSQPNSVDNPYKINNEYDLRKLAYWVNTVFTAEQTVELAQQEKYTRASFRMENHLNLSSWNWEPIGTALNPFLGNFSGGGHSIYGLTIIDDLTTVSEDNEDIDDTFAGLFGYVKYFKDETVEYTPTIQLLGLKDTVIITNRTYVGAIVAYGFGADPNKFTEGKTVKFENKSVTVSEDDIRTYSNATGAIIIEDCYNIGYIQGGANVGGIAGALLYGSAIYNCYNSPMTKKSFNSVEYNSKHDVYSANETANVGGMVGYAVSSGQAVVYKSINSALVSRADVEAIRDDGQESSIASNASITNIGFVIGNKVDAGSSSLYSSAMFAKRSFSFKDDFGFGRAYSLIPSYATSKLSSVEQFASGEWKNNSSKIWAMESSVNNGLPVLVQVPQLIKYDFGSKIADTSSTDITYTDMEDASEAYGSFQTTPVMVDDVNGFSFFEQGQTPFIKTNISAKQKYEFYNWQINYSGDSLIGDQWNTSMAKIESASVFTSHDATLFTTFAYKQYTVTLSIDSDNYDADTTTIRVNETGLEANINTDITARYIDTVTFSVTPKSGYRVSSWTNNYQSSLAPNGSNAVFSIQQYLDAFVAENPDSTIPERLSTIAVVTPKEFTLDLSANETVGSVNAVINENAVTTGAVVKFGENMLLTAEVTDDRYEFVGWQINGIVEGKELTYLFTLGNYDEETLTIVGLFEKKKFNISLNQTSGGTISIIAPNTNVYYYGDNVVIQANAETGYDLTGFKLTIGETPYDFSAGSAGVVVDLENGTLTISNITDHIVCEAIFTIQKFTLNVVLSHANGAEVYNGDNNASLIGTHEFDYNTVLSLVIRLSEGYQIVSIVDDLNNEFGTQPTFAITRNTTINIDLEIIKLNVQVILNVDDNSYILHDDCVSGIGLYDYGSPVQIIVNQPAFLVFSNWEVQGNSIEGAVTNGSKFTCPRITDNIILRANLRVKTVNITVDSKGLPISAGVIKANGNTITEKTTLTQKYRTEVRFELSNDSTSSAVFSYWEVNGIPTSTESEFSIIISDENLNVTAVFIPRKYTISANAVRWNQEANGYDDLSNAGVISGLYANSLEYGRQINVTATAKEGFRFVGWYVWDLNSASNRGTKVSAESTLNMAITKDLKLYANFERVSKVLLGMSDANAGTVTGAGEYLVGDTVTVKATSKTGYRFVGWRESGQEVSKNESYTFTTNRSDRTIIAEFEPIFTVILTTNDNKLGKVVGNTTGKYRENVVLQAVSENNCSFVGWVVNDVVISTDATLNLSLNGDIEVRALFKKNFDWNILIILAGCFMFAIILIAGSAMYIKMKEAEPMPVRVLLSSKDDKELLQKPRKRERYRDTIEPVPTRKNTRQNVAPIPVRKITVAPVNHNGELVGRKQKASEEKPTLKTEIQDEKIEKQEVKEEKVAKTTATETPRTVQANKNSSKKNHSLNKHKNKKHSKKK